MIVCEMVFLRVFLLAAQYAAVGGQLLAEPLASYALSRRFRLALRAALSLQ